MPYKTLEELRAKLRARTGFSAAGAAAGVNQEHLNAILQDAQSVLYWTHDWVKLKKYETVSVGIDQYLVNYPTLANPERIKGISVNNGGVWSRPLPRGISPPMYTTQDNNGPPRRWEPYTQIELWPKADQAYDVRIFYIQSLDRFTENGDRATLDDDMIFTLALGDFKAHLRQPDAPVYQTRANTLLTTLKSKSWGQSTFGPADYVEEEALPKPVVV